MDCEHDQQLRAMLMAAISRAPTHSDVLVDLRNSSFCDSAGLNALLDARQQARERGSKLMLAAPSHQMIRLVQLTGSMALFTLCPAVPRRPHAAAPVGQRRNPAPQHRQASARSGRRRTCPGDPPPRGNGTTSTSRSPRRAAVNRTSEPKRSPPAP
ncbi:STAS domain-containing protein [Streptomyces virginiae]|uniref:STAS domain-containing protein n=1 Tax=Streptomyces virginiae TaxID=1961 RepID=UPI003D318D7E